MKFRYLPVFIFTIAILGFISQVRFKPQTTPFTPLAPAGTWEDQNAEPCTAAQEQALLNGVPFEEMGCKRRGLG
ncbi:MAG: hypothetical protein AAF810_24025 [Cyanobacteria bacterium P01_D01_bin.36]